MKITKDFTQALAELVTLSDKYSGKVVDVEIKTHREKRSLSQNAIAWRYINEIGNVLKKSKEEVYFQMIQDYGQSEIVSVLSSIEVKGYFKYFKEVGTGTVENKEFTHYKIFKGSSEYNSKEMSILIDGILDECKQLEISTMTREDIALLRLI